MCIQDSFNYISIIQPLYMACPFQSVDFNTFHILADFYN